MNRLIATLALLGIFLPTLASADDGKWQYALSPYLWFAGLKGDIATTPPFPPVSVDIPPSDAIEDTEVGLMLGFDMSKGKHGLVADLVYTDVQSDIELIPEPISLNMKSTSETTMFSLGYQYVMYHEGAARVSVLAGGRYWQLDSRLEFGLGGTALSGLTVEHDESWVDPLIGVKGSSPFSVGSKFYIQGSAIIGGFGVGADFLYDLSVAVGYQFNKAIGAGVGYRLYDVDYQKDDFLYDVTQQGWLIGLTWAF
jgi:hypothetical protein